MSEPCRIGSLVSLAEPAAPVAAAARSPQPTRPRQLRRRRFVALVAAVGSTLLVTAILTSLIAIGGAYRPLPLESESAPPLEPDRRLAALAPRGWWITIDTRSNLLRVFRNGELQREAKCSTGSGYRLRDPRNGRVWSFDSPLGERRVERKVKDPVWYKPDWAFIEEGYLPPRDPALRVDRVSLGEYGLYLGDGYIIHGTLFQTLLGRPVTHGCIRLGDEDLRYLYQHIPLGTRVYLY